jgi:hypothetical protein
MECDVSKHGTRQIGASEQPDEMWHSLSRTSKHLLPLMLRGKRMCSKFIWLTLSLSLSVSLSLSLSLLLCFCNLLFQSQLLLRFALFATALRRDILAAAVLFDIIVVLLLLLSFRLVTG